MSVKASTFDVKAVGPEDQHSAALTVVEYSKDVQEADMFLKMLGLKETPEEEE